MSTASRDNMVRFIFPFSSAQQGVVKKIYKAYLNTKDWKNLDAREKNQTISDLIYFNVVAPLPFLLTGAIGAAGYAMLSDDEEDHDKELTRVLYDLAIDASQAHLTALGIPGLLLNTTINEARDRSHFNEGPAYNVKADIGKQLVTWLKSGRYWEDLTPAEKKEFRKNYKGDNPENIEDIYNELVRNVITRDVL
jgi:hypothetical protein